MIHQLISNMCEMGTVSCSTIQQNKLTIYINENVCLKTYCTSEKPFINHCMYSKYMCSFIY